MSDEVKALTYPAFSGYSSNNRSRINYIARPNYQDRQIVTAKWVSEVALFAITRPSHHPIVSPQKALLNRSKRASNFTVAATAPHHAILLIFNRFRTPTHHSKYCAHATMKHSPTPRLWVWLWALAPTAFRRRFWTTSPSLRRTTM